ncbi:DUF4270 family protein [Spirosoma rhododendri]|uniref:DUF4270 domain-containing protein n=1 Tax=Spirosoma rhododendri TaxID=2728024 RepID=A0A7L5DIN1_9BACT|nr:DUF4270 family protein [Spirosoma rhododendri]QJD77915.1 DUF4270 domain-containing protein [Spirosoma rhododendri]
MHFIHRVAGLLMAALCLCACQSGRLDIGQAIINPQEFSIQALDTISIRVSTVLSPDSFVTSAQSSADTAFLVGRWADSNTGTLTTRGYGNVDYASNPLASTSNLTLDSLVFELGYAYAYGDTTTAFSVEVHQLQTALNRSKVYYNTSSVPYDSKALFARTVTPGPGTPVTTSAGTPLSRAYRQIRFRMNTTVAQSFFTALTDGSIVDNVTMDEFWKGFVVLTPASGNTMAGFSTNNLTGLRLYYHAVDNNTDVVVRSSSIHFPLQTTHFTQFISDRSGTPLAALQTRSDAVSSNLTGRSSSLVPGMGLRTRIEFPYINQFELPTGYAGVNSAQLVLEPIRQTLRDNLVPPDLAIFEANAQNELLSVVPIGAIGNVAQNNAAGYFYDPAQPELTDSYTFDITQYATNLIRGRLPNRPIIITNTSTDLRTLARRVTIGDQQRSSDRIRLRLFLTSAQ